MGLDKRSMSITKSEACGLKSDWRLHCHSDDFRATFKIGNDNVGFFDGHHELSPESVRYTATSHFLKQQITTIEYEGWRRHVQHLRADEGVRIIFHLRNLQGQAQLARLIDNAKFRKIGWCEPLVADPNHPILAINFCEELVEKHPYYLDRLFEAVNHFEQIPNEIVLDLKRVVAHSCLHKFFRMIFVTSITKAQESIRSTALGEVDSPFYLAAQFCVQHKMYPEARDLAKLITKVHWQYEQGSALEREAFEQEIVALQEQVVRLQWRELYPNFEQPNTTQQCKLPPCYSKGINLHASKTPQQRFAQAGQHFQVERIKATPHFPAMRFASKKPEHNTKVASKPKASPAA